MRVEGGGIVQVEREVRKKKGWKVRETQRDKRKGEEAWPMYNNMGDLTLVHCSSSC